jgi:transposase
MSSPLEELSAVVLVLRAEVEDLQVRLAAAGGRAAAAEARAVAAEARCAVLEQENADLRARLGKDSSNSSKPPSSDSAFKRKPPKSATGRKPGGQPGHKGATRAWVDPEKVTRREVLRPSTCSCGCSLSGVVAGVGTRARQVVEIPTITPEVVEYVTEALRCPRCGVVNQAELPPEATTCTGPNLTALAATLVGEYHLSRDAAAALLQSVLGVPIAPSTVQDCCNRVSEALAEPKAVVDAVLEDEPELHMDETSWKQSKVLHWLWVAHGRHVTSYAINRRRGADQLAGWFPDGFGGIVICDRWRPYERFERRQLCWSHLERDLQAIIDRGGAGAADAQVALRGAEEMFTYWHRFKDGDCSRAALQHDTADFRARFRAFCDAGAAQSADRKWRALGRDLVRQWHAVFRFLDAEGVEPTNNQAERDLRGSVMWRRGSQGTRTNAGSAFVERMLTVTANCRRQGRSALTFVTQALRALWAGDPPPSLLPDTG